MDKTLKLYRYVDGGVNDTPFPNIDNQIEIGAFRYDAKRMGGAPIITASVNYPSCLDNEWTDNVYAEFNGEKYLLKQTPTSSYDNADTMYKHDIELVSERIILDNVYFFDAVVGNPSGSDKPVSNGTKVVFFGDVHEFAERLNASLEYAKLLKWENGVDEKGNSIKIPNGYNVVVDDDKNITTEERLMSFEDQFFSNVLQEIYNTYEVPYYFVGKTIHIGYANEGVPAPTFSYGADNALLSITKNNANYKVVNRVTGTGSSDNIPFYYPNDSPKGNISAKLSTTSSNFSIEVANYQRFSDAIALDGVIENGSFSVKAEGFALEGEEYTNGKTPTAHIKLQNSLMYRENLSFVASSSLRAKGTYALRMTFTSGTNNNPTDANPIIAKITVDGKTIDYTSITGNKLLFYFDVDFSESMRKDVVVEIALSFRNNGFTSVRRSYSITPMENSAWFYDGNIVDLRELGLKYSGTPNNGDKITQVLDGYINTSQKLLPFKYRQTGGADRFYNATNNTYDGVVFNNPFTEGKPIEHIISVEDIKPSIKEMMFNGARIDMFEAFAYDNDDNEETYQDSQGNIVKKHPYFFGKLKPLGFNLFDHAIEQQPMVISFTSGNSGACHFEIGVTEGYPQMNPVQLNNDGSLKRDSEGNVICGVREKITQYNESQQDTTNNSVWIALKKEEETYGILMPTKKCRPTRNDTFVILGISLPKEYIINAEKKLESEIIKYLKDNNDEKFSFSVRLSRIYFEENPDILKCLNENSRINIEYNNITYPLYVSSFSFNLSNGDVLPDITIELSDTLAVSQNALQNTISQAKAIVSSGIANIDVLALASPYFIRKDAKDEANATINFKKGVEFGKGGAVKVAEDGSAKLTIDYLEVNKKATFSSLEIQEKTHAGGQILLTPAAINCNRVEELDDVYRCYFQTKGEDGDEIFNQFAVGDQAICQTYNTWGNKYYWRLVVGTGDDYIELSKEDCDEGSGVPRAGDKIIQLGSREDESRQNAIVIAAHGDGSPYIIQYKGINSFEMSDEKIVTKLSSTENIFTGVVNISAGSTGFENIGLDVNIGGQNMLRNSGFTGDYLSEPLANDSVLDAASEMYGGKLQHWKTPDTNEVIELKDISASGYGVSLGGGMLTQELYHGIIAGESYVFSMKAKSDMTLVEGQHNVTVSCGGITNNISVSNEWSKYVIKFVANISGNIFQISGIDTTICELQLERGTIETAWAMSILDNSSDRAYYLSLDHLGNAMNASTTIAGGLVLANTIQVGNYKDKVMIEDTGGMSGSYAKKEDPFIWGGGSLQDAIDTIGSNGVNGANFVVTHGGKAILNEAVVRGTIYAKDGSFEGEIKANRGNFGDLHIVSSETWGDAGLEGTKVYDETETHNLQLYSDYFCMEAFNNGNLIDSVKISPYWYGDRYDMDGIVHIYTSGERAAINLEGGFIRGFRMPIISTSNDTVDLYGYFQNIVILNSRTNNLKNVYLPTRATKGDTIHIINSHRSALIVGMKDNTKKIVFNTEDGTTDDAAGWNDGANNPYKVEAYFDGSMWYLCPIR